jgi:hypothetical protein
MRVLPQLQLLRAACSVAFADDDDGGLGGGVYVRDSKFTVQVRPS